MTGGIGTFGVLHVAIAPAPDASADRGLCTSTTGRDSIPEQTRLIRRR